MCRFLMSGLGAWRHITRAVCLRTGRTITDCKNIGIASCLKSLRDNEFADSVGLEPIQMTKNVRALHAGGPDHKFGRNEAAIRKLYTVCANLSGS